MAVGTSTSYFSNAIVGQPMVGVDIDVHQVDLTPKYQVGFGFIRADGNRYRYCHFGADVNRALVVSQNMTESNSTTPELHIGSTVANLTRPEGQIIDANAIGSHYIQCSLTAVAHQFAGAYATVASGTGAGYTYRIKDNTVTGSPKLGESLLNLYKPIVVAVDSNTGFTIAGSPYSNVETSDTTDRIPIGVTVAGVSDTNFAWVCTKGVTTVLNDANAISTGGANAYLSTTTTGTVQYSSTLGVTGATGSGLSIVPLIGRFVIGGSSGAYSTIIASLE